MSNDKTTEQMVQEKGLNAPRLTPKLIDNVIVGEYYHIVPNTTLTICVLTLENGLTVTGESAAYLMENFDKEIGRRVPERMQENKYGNLKVIS